MNCFIMANTGKPLAIKMAERVAKYITLQGGNCLFQSEFAEYLSGEYEYLSTMEAVEKSDVVITIGGDGTLLHTAALLFDYNKPLLGINLGQLGFLATVEEDEVEEKLTLLLKGQYKLEERLLLEGKIDGNYYATALNEFVLYKGAYSKTVECEVFCDKESIGKYRADGVIVATPTGSTGYSLSGGGSILDTKLPAMIVTPICAHSLSAPAIVLSAFRKLEIKICGETMVILSADGHNESILEQYKTVEVTASNKKIQMIYFDTNEQFKAIDKKLKGS